MKRIGQYELLEEIARGGMGVVYRARDIHLEREVAVKLLITTTRGEPRQRLIREAQSLARLRHPNIVSIHNAGDEGGHPFLVMDLIRGETLEARIRREGALAPREAARIAQKLAEALQYAHERGVLHRDIKPDNVLVAGVEDEPLLTDFGMAKAIDASAGGLSTTGQLMGTPGYWPPEQAEGKLDRIGPASDVFGLGATLYAALTASPPFAGASWLELSEAMARGPTPFAEHGARPDPALERICLKCLALAPEDRYGSARELAAALNGYLASGRGSESRAVRRGRGRGASGPGWTRADADVASGRRRGAVVAAAVGSAALLAALLGLATATRERDQALAQAEAATVALAEAAEEARAAAATRDALDRRLADLVGQLARAEEARAAAERGRVDAERDRAALEERTRELEAQVRPPAERASPRPARPRPASEDLGPDPRAWIRRGQSRRSAGDPAAAIADYSRALTLDPKSVEALSGRAFCHYALRDLPAALRDFDEAVRLGDDDPNVLLYRGFARRDSGDWAAANADFERALELDPDFADALVVLGLWYGRGGGDRPRGLRYLRRAIELLPAEDPVALQAKRGLAALGESAD